MKLIDNIPVFGPPDEGALRQIKVCAETAPYVAMMGDHHKGYAVPIGGVVAYRNQISPSGVGFDIACGNKAVLTDMPGSEARANIDRIMDDIWKTIKFGVGESNPEKPEDPLFDDELWKEKPLSSLKAKAENQLGTIGSGNHYVDVFVDDKDRTWVGVHFGSRGFGHNAATWFLEKAGATDGMDVAPCVVDLDHEFGQFYVAAMELAGKYAYAGRDWVCKTVVERILGAKALDSVHNHHNFAWKETHWNEELWVVRKGATPAFPGQRGFVGGSMGDISVILEGVAPEDEETRAIQRLAMFSTVHGAGRIMGRMEAKGKKDRSTGEWKREPKVHRSEMIEWIKREGVQLRGAGVDESPHCYKRLPEVLEEHAGTIKILEVLHPIGVAMANDGRSED